MAAWPESIRAALAPHGDLRPALPLAELEPGLKRGRVTVSWAQLSGWIHPCPAVSIPGDTTLELPLALLAPLFLASRKAAVPRKQVAIGENIPDLFTSQKASPTPEPILVATPPPAVPPASPAPAIIPIPAAAKPPTPVANRSIGEVLGEPGRIEWQPTDLTRATASLEGVSGAIIAMHDGFPVAGQLPPELDQDTFAALAVELHARANQFATSLKLTTSETVTVTLGDLPVHICKTPSVFLAVIGRPGLALPLDQIATVVRHLDAPHS